MLCGVLTQPAPGLIQIMIYPRAPVLPKLGTLSYHQVEAANGLLQKLINQSPTSSDQRPIITGLAASLTAQYRIDSKRDPLA